VNSLVGYTGFVGSNLFQEGHFDRVYNSTNIQEAYGTKPDLLVYAGVRAAKYLANRDAEADWREVSKAIENIKAIAPKKLVLISTIDVFTDSCNKDEDAVPVGEGLHPYGLNRYRLEEWVKSYKKDGCMIVRLPGLYGMNIRKNFIYDMLTYIPAMLSADKYKDLSVKSSLIAQTYVPLENGFFQYRSQSGAEDAVVEEFKKTGFSALNFTDSRGVFQFYGLKHLWQHIQLGLQHRIPLLHLATEPVQISELYTYIYGTTFANELDRPVPRYDFRTKYASLYGGAHGYIYSKAVVLADIKKFVEEYRK